MNEQNAPSSAVATPPEASPYSELKRIIEEETVRTAHQQETQRTARSQTTQPTDTARPTARYGLD